MIGRRVGSRRVLMGLRDARALLHDARGWPMGEVLGYQFVALGKSVVHLGSAGWVREELAGLGPDAALLPLQGRSDIHRVALRMVEILEARCVVPHHHDDFCPPISQTIALDRFVELVQTQMPAVGIVEPRIGEWMALC